MVVLAWLGVLIYLITQHDGMAQRSTREAAREWDEARRAVGFGVADELDRMESKARLSDGEHQRLRSVSSARPGRIPQEPDPSARASASILARVASRTAYSASSIAPYA
jgi:hypothetical protein